MTSLLSRLQSLSGPDREIDAVIFEHFGKIDEDHCRMWCSMDGRTDLTRERFIKAWAPEYTKSLDAAKLLLPEKKYWLAGFYHSGFKAEIWTHAPFKSVIGESDANDAIALLIAILKAKEDKL